MMRCPQCGIRVADAAPRCPTHGQISLQAPPAAAPEPGAPRDSQIPPAFSALGYRIVRLLGRGGFGAVYLGERVEDGLLLAIKVALNSQGDAVQSLMREVAALRIVGPPHVPEVFDAGTFA